MIVSPIVDRVVTIAMEHAGFSIKRSTDRTIGKAIVWRRNLVGSYLQIHFGDQELYGEPHLKRWVLSYGHDPDATVLIALDLDMFVALRIAKSLEAAASSTVLPVSHRSTSSGARPHPRRQPADARTAALADRSAQARAVIH